MTPRKSKLRDLGCDCVVDIPRELIGLIPTCSRHALPLSPNSTCTPLYIGFTTAGNITLAAPLVSSPMRAAVYDYSPSMACQNGWFVTLDTGEYLGSRDRPGPGDVHLGFHKVMPFGWVLGRTVGLILTSIASALRRDRSRARSGCTPIPWT